MIHVQFLEDEARYHKQFLLNTQISILKSQKRFLNYAKLRRKELYLKSAMASKIKQVSRNLEIFQSFLPEIKEYKIISKDREDERIEQELRQIKERLDNFSRASN